MKAIPFVRCRSGWKPLRAAALSLMVTAAALSGCGIYRHEVLQGNFNKSYFTKIDIRIEKEVKLYSKSAKILTMHPSSSYTLQQDANKQYVLRINNPQIFWSTSKYLVILVK